MCRHAHAHATQLVSIDMQATKALPADGLVVQLTVPAETCRVGIATTLGCSFCPGKAVGEQEATRESILLTWDTDSSFGTDTRASRKTT